MLELTRLLVIVFVMLEKYNIIQQKIKSWGTQIHTNSNKNYKPIKKLKITKNCIHLDVFKCSFVKTAE
jgi:hypothetical protein